MKHTKQMGCISQPQGRIFPRSLCLLWVLSCGVLSASCASTLSVDESLLAGMYGSSTEGALSKAYIRYLSGESEMVDVRVAEVAWLETHPWDTPEALVDARRDLTYTARLIEQAMVRQVGQEHPRVAAVAARLKALEGLAQGRFADHVKQRLMVALASEPTTVDAARGYWLAMSQSADESMRDVAIDRLSRLPESAALPVLRQPGAVAADPERPAASISPLALAVQPSVVSLKVLDDRGRAVGQGSGVVIGRSDVVVTSYHVVEKASGMTVKTSLGKEFPVSQILSVKPSMDLALLLVAGLSLPPLRMEPSRLVRVGDRVVALGSPKGLDGTVTDGIVSAIRKLPDFDTEVIQTTAPISEGSSGGALVSLQGQLVGVTTLILQSGQNLNFAVPASAVQELYDNTVHNRDLSAIPWPGGTAVADTAQQMFETAKQHLERGDVAAASKVCEQGLASHPGDSGLLVCAVVTRTAQCDRPGAMAAVELLREKDTVAWAAGMALVKDADDDGLWQRCRPEPAR